MRLRIFKAADGDCCLVSGKDGANLLVDGGRGASYDEHVAPALGAMHENGERLDRVCVSHIDDDHISGVLRMLDDKVAWRVHRHQRDVLGNAAHQPPVAPEPPEIDALWHNGFSEFLGKNKGPIADQLAMRVAYLSLAASAEGTGRRAEAEGWHNLIQGEEKALRLRRRIDGRQLGIPLNPERDKRVMGLFPGMEQPLEVGALRVAMIAPRPDDLETLRDEWNDWLRTHKAALEKIRDDARADEEDLGLSDVGRWLYRHRRFAAEIGDTGALTPPNVASIMFLVEEGARSILMTGDGGWDRILAGLGDAGKLRPNGTLHVEVLKVPHHGSEHNTSQEFAKKVTADHYVFCANGASENPHPEVVAAYVDSRLATDARRSANPEAGDPFTFWFTHGPDDDLTTSRKAHMKTIRDLVASRAAASGGRMTVNVLTTSHRDIDLA